MSRITWKLFFLLFCPINSACLCSAYIQINPKLQRLLTKLQSRQFMHHYYLIFESKPLTLGCKHSLKEDWNLKNKITRNWIKWWKTCYFYPSIFLIYGFNTMCFAFLFRVSLSYHIKCSEVHIPHRPEGQFKRSLYSFKCLFPCRRR